MGRFSSLEALERLEPGEADLIRAAARRDVTDRVRARVDLLAGEDRVLLMMYLEAGSSFRRIARLLGMSHTSVARRIHKLLERLSDETYTLCLQCRERFSDGELAIVRDHFIRGLSVRRIARDSSLCHYRVRAAIRKARLCARAQEKVLPDHGGEIRSSKSETSVKDKRQ